MFPVGFYLKKKKSSSFGQLVICFLITLYEKKRAQKNYELDTKTAYNTRFFHSVQVFKWTGKGS